MEDNALELTGVEPPWLIALLDKHNAHHSGGSPSGNHPDYTKGFDY